MWHSRIPTARLILSAKGDRTSADVFNHEWTLFYAKGQYLYDVHKMFRYLDPLPVCIWY